MSDAYNFGLSGSISGGQSAIVRGASNPLSSSSYQNPLNGGLNGGGGGFSVGDSYQSRAFVDNQSSIIGTNSVNINVGSLAQNSGNTNIIAALIANRDSSGNDLGNLTLTTKSLTNNNLHNYNNTDGSNFSTNLQIGRNPNNPTASGNLALNLNMHGSEQSSDSIATIGVGNLNISGNSTNNEINRDITLTETNKRSQVTSDFDAELKIDLRLLAVAGNLIIGDSKAAKGNANDYWNGILSGTNLSSDVLFGTNKSELNPQKTEVGMSSKDAILVTPVWASRVIDERNDEVNKQTGKITYHPAPNLWVGNLLGGDTSTVGRDDQGCRDSGFCRVIISDESYLLKAMYYGIPGFKSSSQFHDAGMIDKQTGKEAGAAYKFFSIFTYFPANYYGAIGTILDAKNWNQNSPQNSNNSNPVFSHDKQSK